MAMSPQDLVDMLRREFPRGVQGKDFEQQALHAVENGLPYGGARFRERIDLDIWGNGVRQRFELPGRGVRLLDENDWVTPVNMNDTLYDQPTVAGGYAANLSGNLAPGTYLATYSWTFPIRDTTGAVTGYADTPPAPIASVTIPGTANGGIVRSALTGLNPSGAYVTDWISSTPNSGELRMAGRQSAMTSTTIANLPTATASLAPVDTPTSPASAMAGSRAGSMTAATRTRPSPRSCWRTSPIPACGCVSPTPARRACPPISMT